MTNSGLLTSIQSRYVWLISRPVSVDKELPPAFGSTVTKRAIPLFQRSRCLVRPLILSCPPFCREVLP